MRVASVVLAVALALCGPLACERESREPKPSVAGSSAKGPQKSLAAPSASPQEILEPDGEFRLPGAARVVAIGDLHGDFSATERAFRLAGAIDESGKWSGGDLVVVQTGDQLDRGPDERQIVEFLERLEKEAKAAGGRLVVLNGNHETMNVLGDFRYVTAEAMGSFDSYQPASPLSIQVEGPSKVRAAAFLPGGGAAQVLARRRIVVMVGDTVFVHGGLTSAHLDYGIDKLNRESKEWMLGKTTLPPRLVVDESGPLWTRIYGEPVVSERACQLLEQTLRRLGARRMAVGHTVQPGGMSSACDGQVFRIDVGLSAAYGDNPVQVLEVTRGEAKILTAP